MLAHPAQDGVKLSPGNLIRNVGMLCQHGVPQLDGSQVTQRIGREVADHATGPVNVLQHALGVIRRGDAQVVFHPGVPDFRQVRHLDGAFHQADLDLQAEHDVQVVGGFIGFHPDQAGLHLVDAAVEVLQAEVCHVFREEHLQGGIEEGPELPAAADQVFPQAGLRFVDGQGG